MAYGDNSLNSMLGGSDWTSLLGGPTSTPQQGGLLSNALNYGRDPYAKAALSLLGGNGGMNAATTTAPIAPRAPAMGSAMGSNALSAYAPRMSYAPTYGGLGGNGTPTQTMPATGAAMPPILTGGATQMPALASNPTLSSTLAKLLNGGTATGQANGQTDGQATNPYDPFRTFGSGFGAGGSAY